MPPGVPSSEAQTTSVDSATIRPNGPTDNLSISEGGTEGSPRDEDDDWSGLNALSGPHHTGPTDDWTSLNASLDASSLDCCDPGTPSGPGNSDKLNLNLICPEADAAAILNNLANNNNDGFGRTVDAQDDSVVDNSLSYGSGLVKNGIDIVGPLTGVTETSTRAPVRESTANDSTS